MFSVGGGSPEWAATNVVTVASASNENGTYYLERGSVRVGIVYFFLRCVSLPPEAGRGTIRLWPGEGGPAFSGLCASACVRLAATL